MSHKGFRCAKFEQRKLIDLLKQTKGAMKIGPFGSALKKETYVESGVKVYAQENIFQEDFSIGDYYITESKYRELQSCELFPGDVVLSMMGTIGACAIFPVNAEKGIMNSHLLRLQFGSNMTSNFAKLLIKDTPQIKSEIDRMSVGSIMTGLSASVVKKLILPVPSILEQKKIAGYFETIDYIITLHQRKLDQLKKLKKYFLQNLFPAKGEKVPRIRFKGFTGDWKQSELEELATFSKGIGYSKSDLLDSGKPIILYGRLYTKYETVITNTDTFVDEKDGSVHSLGGEVIVPASGETAEDISIASVVKKSGIIIGGDLNIIHPSNNIDSTFLAISISNGEPHKDMARRAQGKSVVHLHNDDLSKIKLWYPSLLKLRSC